MVWTEITRAKYCRDKLRYASDTTDEEWAMIAPYMPCKNRRGRPRVTEMRTLVNSIFFIARSGCQWRLLPKEFPPYKTVQRYFYRWRDDGTWQKINHHLVMMVREADGREASPTAGVIDSQSAGGPRGFDAAKKVKGRKRHLLTDIAGFLIAGIVHEASIQDRDGAPASPIDPKCFPLVASCLRRWRLCRSKAQKGACLNRLVDHLDRQTIRCRQGLQTVATPLDYRTNHRMAQPQSSACKRLRGHNCERRNMAHDR
jgi:transposase